MSEDVAVGVISEVFGKLHEAFRVIEYAARESEGTGRHWSESASVV
jgi:rRNA processing protein Gar1